MKLTGTHTFPFPRRDVWDALMDPAVLARTLPGCERLERLDDERLVGSMSVKVGPVGGKFDGTLRMTDRRPPEGYRMRLDGQGPSGFVKGEGQIALEEADGGTLLRYDLDADVGGRLAGVGQRVLESSAKVIARQGLEGLGQQLQLRAAAGGPSVAVPAATATDAAIGAPSPAAATLESPLAPAEPQVAVPAAAPPSVVTGSGPAGAAFAGRFAREVAAELVPRKARPWIVVGVLVVLALVIVLGVRACG